MKTLDVLAAVLLVAGGLNWGLVGLIELDLVAVAFGSGSWLARGIYLAVGAAALHQAFALRSIQERWGIAAPVPVAFAENRPSHH